MSFRTGIALATNPTSVTLPASGLSSTVATLNGTIDAGAIIGGTKVSLDSPSPVVPLTYRRLEA